MVRRTMNGLALLLVAASIGSPACGAEAQLAAAAVVVSPQGAFAERLAAQEIRRYVYLRTASLLPIVEDPAHAQGGLIVVGSKERPAIRGLLDDASLKASVEGLAAEQYLLRSIRHRGRDVVLVVGGDPTGTLYAAYRLAEHLGVRFYLDGDVLPDDRVPLVLSGLDEVGRPLFDRRGIQPFHDFPEGPDWWNADDYKAILAQLPKLRMNFFGLHTYPQGGVGPEPLTWIGLLWRHWAGREGEVQLSLPPLHHRQRHLGLSPHEDRRLPLRRGRAVRPRRLRGRLHGRHDALAAQTMTTPTRCSTAWAGSCGRASPSPGGWASRPA